METSSSDVKQIHRSVYMLAKILDERKKNATKFSHLFEMDLVKEREDLIENCIKLMFKDHEIIGKKSREILWRKGYYDFIAIFKRNWRKDEKSGIDVVYREKLREFLLEGITIYKKIVVKLETIYDLDLQYLIDFTIINDKKDNNCNNEEIINNKIIPINGYTPEKSLEAINYALETIHSSLLSLGDLHRYFIEFNFDLPVITRNDAASYYFEAFKLNPTIGMSQNQLGTLYYGQNHDLDSIYYYLYSLICTVPFELSENNVTKLILSHIDYLEEIDPDKSDINLRDFYARFFLIVDIYFFDKDVPDFNSLCHCVLIDLRKILSSKTIQIKEECLFKIVSILLFCLSKLKMINSEKVYSLNAFLVAVCSDLINACINNLEEFITLKTKQNFNFQEIYTEMFNKFELVVKRSREEYKMFYENNMIKPITVITNGTKSNKNTDSDYCNGNASGSGSRAGDGVDVDGSFGSSCGRSQKSENNMILRNPFLSNGIKTEIKIKRPTQSDIARSSDEAKESDLKSPMSSTTKNKRRNIKIRRRRKKMHQSDIESSCYDSDSDSDDSELSSRAGEHDDDLENSDISSNFESDFTDDDNDNYHDDDNDEDDDDEPNIVVNNNTGDDKNKDNNSEIKNNIKENEINGFKKPSSITFSDNEEDVVVLEEHLIYPDDNVENNQMIDKFVNLTVSNQGDDTLTFKSDENDDNSHTKIESSIINENNNNLMDDDNNNKESPVKLKYKNKYSKIDPNIVIEFLQTSITVRPLKILFDWLRVNPDILFGCYHTNPEFIHKIMILLNYFNIDIFTRKVYFERSLINVGNVRTDLEKLFDIRSTIPLSEDYTLKNFDILKNSQTKLDWEITIKDRITKDEEMIMRIFKMVDFGFFICKMKKFNYNFCAKTRRFAENLKKKKSNEKKKSILNINKNKNGNRRERRRNPRRRNNNSTSNNDENNSGEGKSKRYNDKKINSKRISSIYNNTSNEEKDTTTVDEGKSSVSIPRKGYLRNRNRNIERNHTSSGADDEKSELPLTGTKSEIMGQLWLRSEIKSLESKIKNKPINVILTPYIVVDSKSLTEYTSIVKNLVKTKKFVVLIPNAVLCDLDELKKHSDGARNVIRWLEQEFSRGNRHLRSQRVNENQAISLIKIPKKLDREASMFVQIAQFCNAVVQSQSDDNDYASDVLTFLSGDNLHEKKLTNFSYTGILDVIPVRYDQISNFYAKYKKK